MSDAAGDGISDMEVRVVSSIILRAHLWAVYHEPLWPVNQGGIYAASDVIGNMRRNGDDERDIKLVRCALDIMRDLNDLPPWPPEGRGRDLLE